MIPIIKSEVNEALKNKGPDILRNILEKAAEPELAARTALATKAIEMKEALFKLQQGIRPTYKGFDLSGAPIGEPSYTKEQTKAYAKVTELQTKLEAAWDKAGLNRVDEGTEGSLPDFTDLGKIVKETLPSLKPETASSDVDPK